MIRTAAAFALAALVALVALRTAFGLFGGLIGLLFSLSWIALKLICVFGAVYFALSMVSPDSARRLREKLGFGEVPRAS